MHNQLVVTQTSWASPGRDRCIVCWTERDFRREGVRNYDAAHGGGLVQLVLSGFFGLSGSKNEI